MMDPVIRYDPKADILVIKLEEGETVDENLLDNDVLLGLGENGRIVSLEVWDASKRGLLETLTDLAREKRAVVDAILEKEARAPA